MESRTVTEAKHHQKPEFRGLRGRNLKRDKAHREDPPAGGQMGRGSDRGMHRKTQESCDLRTPAAAVWASQRF